MAEATACHWRVARLRLQGGALVERQPQQRQDVINASAQALLGPFGWRTTVRPACRIFDAVGVVDPVKRA